MARHYECDSLRSPPWIEYRLNIFVCILDTKIGQFSMNHKADERRVDHISARKSGYAIESISALRTSDDGEVVGTGNQTRLNYPVNQLISLFKLSGVRVKYPYAPG